MELQDELMSLAEEEIKPVDADPMEEETRDSDPMETPEYVPNLKYRVGDEEREFDERVRGHITDKESEEYYRDLFSKAGGLELSKSRHQEKEKQWQQTHSEYTGLQNQFNQVKNSLEQINGLKSEDFGTFQKIWEIPDAAILSRAAEIVKILNDPQAQDAANRVYADRINSMQQQHQISQTTQYQQQLHRQVHDMKMSTALGNPDIQKFASDYDRRVGTPGAFLEEVNRIGSAEFSAGRYIDPQVVVGAAHQRLSKLIGSFSPQPEPESQERVSKDPQQSRRPTLPNLGTGRTGTATSKKMKSINDLRKLANSMG